MGYAYAVGIRLSVANLASQGLRLIAKDMLGLYGVTTNLQTKLSALKLAAVGYGLDKAGMGIFHGLEKTISASKDYVSQLSLMNAAGMSHVEIANSIASAWSTSHSVLTSTAAGNLRQLRELRSLFGDQHMAEAYAVLPTVSRTQAMMEALTGRRNEQIGFEMAKVAELRQTGVMTLPFLQRNMEQLSRTLYAMGGTITASDYLTTMKYAKTAALSLSDKFVYQELPTLIQEVKSASGGMMGNASQAGTALMTLYSSIVQGKVPKSALPIWMATGLVKPSDVIQNATGQWQVRPGGIEGAQLFQSDPFLWAQQVAPQLERYAKTHHLNMLQLISTMFGARNSQWMMNTLIAKAGQIQRDSLLISKTPNNLAIYQGLLKTNPMLAEQALHAQWQNVLSIIGYSILPKILPLMVSFAGDLNSVGNWMQKHPRLTSDLVISLGALSASLVVLSNVLMTRALINFLGIGPALSKMLLAPIGALGSLAKVLGGVAVAATAGYAIGTEISKHLLEGNKAGDAVGSTIAHIMAFLGSRTAKDAIRTNSAWNTGPITTPAAGAIQRPESVTRGHATYIMKAPQPVVHVTVQNKVSRDGLTTLVLQGLKKGFQAPQTGLSDFDGSAALVPAGGVQR